MSALLKEAQEGIYSVHHHAVGDGIDYARALVEHHPGALSFRTGAGRLYYGLNKCLPTIRGLEDEKALLCHQLERCIYPFLANVMAQAVEVRMMISADADKLRPPTIVGETEVLIALDTERSLMRRVLLPPYHALTDAAALDISAGIIIESRAINYGYHRLKEDRGTRPAGATSNLPNREEENRFKDPLIPLEVEWRHEGIDPEEEMHHIEERAHATHLAHLRHEREEAAHEAHEAHEGHEAHESHASHAHHEAEHAHLAGAHEHLAAHPAHTPHEAHAAHAHEEHEFHMHPAAHGNDAHAGPHLEHAVHAEHALHAEHPAHDEHPHPGHHDLHAGPHLEHAPHPAHASHAEHAAHAEHAVHLDHAGPHIEHEHLHLMHELAHTGHHPEHAHVEHHEVHAEHAEHVHEEGEHLEPHHAAALHEDGAHPEHAEHHEAHAETHEHAGPHPEHEAHAHPAGAHHDEHPAAHAEAHHEEHAEAHEHAGPHPEHHDEEHKEVHLAAAHTEPHAAPHADPSHTSHEELERREIKTAEHEEFEPHYAAAVATPSSPHPMAQATAHIQPQPYTGVPSVTVAAAPQPQAFKVSNLDLQKAEHAPAYVHLLDMPVHHHVYEQLESPQQKPDLQVKQQLSAQAALDRPMQADAKPVVIAAATQTEIKPVVLPAAISPIAKDRPRRLNREAFHARLHQFGPMPGGMAGESMEEV